MSEESTRGWVDGGGGEGEEGLGSTAGGAEGGANKGLKVGAWTGCEGAPKEPVPTLVLTPKGKEGEGEEGKEEGAEGKEFRSPPRPPNDRDGEGRGLKVEKGAEGEGDC